MNRARPGGRGGCVHVAERSPKQKDALPPFNKPPPPTRPATAAARNLKMAPHLTSPRRPLAPPPAAAPQGILGAPGRAAARGGAALPGERAHAASPLLLAPAPSAWHRPHAVEAAAGGNGPAAPLRPSPRREGRWRCGGLGGRALRAAFSGTDALLPGSVLRYERTPYFT